MKFGKRLCALVLSAIMLLASVSAVSAANGTIIMNLGSNVMTVNGSSVAIDADPAIKPQVQTVNGFGYTMLPLRAVVESMGGTVAYDAATKNITMTYNGTTMTHVIGTATAYVNGVSQPLAITSYAANNRTYVHLRAIELLSPAITVRWDAGAPDRVEITYPSAAQPPVMILPDGSGTENTDGAPVIIYPDGTEPVDMELHICNMLGEDFTMSVLLLGKAEKNATMYSQPLDDLYFDEPQVLRKQLTPGFYNISCHANGGIYHWKNIQLTGGAQYLNLYAGGVFHVSGDADDLGRPAYELGMGTDPDVKRDETAEIILYNKTGGRLHSFRIYSGSTMTDAVYEHEDIYEDRIADGGKTMFELDYSEDAPYFTIVAEINVRTSFYDPGGMMVTRVYSGVDLSGDTVIVTLESGQKHTVQPYRGEDEVWFRNRTGKTITELCFTIDPYGDDPETSDNLLDEPLEDEEQVLISDYSCWDLSGKDVEITAELDRSRRYSVDIKNEPVGVILLTMDHSYHISALYDAEIDADNSFEEGIFLRNISRYDFEELYVVNRTLAEGDGFRYDEEEYFEDHPEDDYEASEYCVEIKDLDKKGGGCFIDEWDIGDLDDCSLVFKVVSMEDDFYGDERLWVVNGFEHNVVIELDLSLSGSVKSEIVSTDIVS